MLCQPCQQKPTIQVPGSCNKCSAMTSHFAYALCGSCAQTMNQCEWCQTPLSGGVNPVAPSGPTPYFVTVRDTDNGATIKSMKSGDEIRVTLGEDQYSNKQWGVKTYDRSSFRLKASGQFVPDQGNPRYGTRTVVFEVISSSGQGDIEFHEITRIWSWWGGSHGGQVVPGGQQWKCTFQIK